MSVRLIHLSIRPSVIQLCVKAEVESSPTTTRDLTQPDTTNKITQYTVQYIVAIVNNVSKSLAIFRFSLI